MENPESLIYLTDVTVTDIFYNTLPLCPPLHPSSLCVGGGGGLVTISYIYNNILVLLHILLGFNISFLLILSL